MKKRKQSNRKNPFKSIKQTKEEPTFLIYARSRKPIPITSKDLMGAIKKSLELIHVDDLLEIHDEESNLLWGKRTGINKEYYES